MKQPEVFLQNIINGYRKYIYCFHIEVVFNNMNFVLHGNINWNSPMHFGIVYASLLAHLFPVRKFVNWIYLNIKNFSLTSLIFSRIYIIFVSYVYDWRNGSSLSWLKEIFGFSAKFQPKTIAFPTNWRGLAFSETIWL